MDKGKRLLHPLLVSLVVHLGGIAFFLFIGKAILHWNGGLNQNLASSAYWVNLQKVTVSPGESPGSSELKPIDSDKPAAQVKPSPHIQAGDQKNSFEGKAKTYNPIVSGQGNSSKPAGGVGDLSDSGVEAKVLSKIRGKILRAKRYPADAAKQKVEGTATVYFKIGTSGEVLEVKIAASSGSALLDQEALETIRRAAPYPVYAKPIRLGLKYELAR